MPICDICQQPEAPDNLFQIMKIGSDDFSYNTRCLRCVELVRAWDRESAAWITLFVVTLASLLCILSSVWVFYFGVNESARSASVLFLIPVVLLPTAFIAWRRSIVSTEDKMTLKTFLEDKKK